MGCYESVPVYEPRLVYAAPPAYGYGAPAPAYPAYAPYAAPPAYPAPPACYPPQPIGYVQQPVGYVQRPDPVGAAVGAGLAGLAAGVLIGEAASW
uniref:Uncharacterized protein n=1 Tax=Zooxanthella nutricula TaxID=1333877 RepID=A0A7S2M4B0_9DINO